MINETFPANFIKIRVGEDLFHFWWCPWFTWFGHGSADKALILRILKHKCWVLMVLMVDERWSELCADG
jgi:hypothetical protein